MRNRPKAPRLGGSWASVGPVVIGTALLAAGLAMLVSGPFAALAFVVPAILYVMVAQPFVGVLLIAATIPLENLFVTSGGVTATRLVGISVAVGWLLGKTLRGESLAPLFRSSFLWIASLFVSVVLASALWAEDPAASYAGFFQLLQLLVLSLIVIDVTDSWSRVRWIVRVLILSGIAAAVLTIIDFAHGGIARAGERIAGVNGTAIILVTLTPFAFYMMQFEDSRVGRLAGYGFLALAVTGVAVTFSRMSFLLLPPLLFILIWQTLQARRARLWMLAVTTAAVVALPSFVPTERLWNRIGSIGPYVESTVEMDRSPDGTVSGRGYHLRVGLAIFQDHPFMGAGYDNYGLLFLNTYQDIVPGSHKRYTTRRSPHSSHVGILADLGLVGFVLWLGVLFVPLRGLWRLRGTSRSARRGSGITVVRAVTYAFLLQTIPYALYTPNQKEKLFWMILALAIAVYTIVRAEQRVRTVQRPIGEALGSYSGLYGSEPSRLPTIW